MFGSVFVSSGMQMSLVRTPHFTILGKEGIKIKLQLCFWFKWMHFCWVRLPADTFALQKDWEAYQTDFSVTITLWRKPSPEESQVHWQLSACIKRRRHIINTRDDTGRGQSTPVSTVIAPFLCEYQIVTFRDMTRYESKQNLWSSLWPTPVVSWKATIWAVA